MGLGKGFGLGLVIYMILNLVMNLLIAVLSGTDIGTWFGGISSDPYLWLSNLFYVNVGIGLTDAATTLLGGITSGLTAITSNNIAFGIIVIIAVILPGLLTAIIAGKLAKGVGKGFASWVLIVAISYVAIFVLFILDLKIGTGGSVFALNVFPTLAPYFVLFDELSIIIIVVIGVITSLMWGCVAALAGRQD